MRFLASLVFIILSCAGVPAQSGKTGFSKYIFRQPEKAIYWVKTSSKLMKLTSSDEECLALSHNGAPVLFTRKILLQVNRKDVLIEILEGGKLALKRQLSDTLFILQAENITDALEVSQRLSSHPDVVACYPVRRHSAQRHYLYDRQPNDPLFLEQWYGENRDPETGAHLGVDLNLRSAWAYSKGEGSIIAVVDDGIDLAHGDLSERTQNMPHFNFFSGQTNGNAYSFRDYHGTAVAGLAAATGNNSRGITGVAPKAGLASWVVFRGDEFLPDEEKLMDLYGYQSNVVHIQNHSWGKVDAEPLEVGLLEQVGISNAVCYGRNGLGTIMVRSAGNQREDKNSANDDGYLATPYVIAVGAVDKQGQVTDYSNPGANLLLCAPGGVAESGLTTTDAHGLDGLNQQWSTNDFADYILPQHGFCGTSAAAPLVSGIVALMLSVNPRLSYRDVQQILILSAKQFDLLDPLMQTNGAGFRVSPNTGFGVPDAGQAVRLAREWKLRPKETVVEFKETNVYNIPDAGLSLQLIGTNLPNGLSTLRFDLSDGPFPQAILVPMPLIYLGRLTEPLSYRIDHKVALVERGSNYFSDKIEYAWQAGAAWVIIYNNEGYTALMHMGGAERTHLPAAFIGQIDGQSLRDALKSGNPISAQFQRKSVVCHFDVTNTLLLEHVGLKVDYEHACRNDVRITVQSPADTLSIMQPNTGDDSAAPASWTYYSTHHFFESSKGKWTVEICDTELSNTGKVNQVSLLLHGMPIEDTDGDGLDDHWEQHYFASLAHGPQDDPDGDGLSNAREQVMQADPSSNQTIPRLDITFWNEKLMRLSWPSVAGNQYSIDISTHLAKSFTLDKEICGEDYESEYLIPSQQQTNAFFRLRSVAK